MKRVHVMTLIALLLLGAAIDANAAVRAWLNRDHIALGDSVVLTVASDGPSGEPDFASLDKNFEVGSTATRSDTTIVNTSTVSSTQWAVELVPRRSGVIDIPALAVGSERTPPLRVGVDARPAADPNARKSAQEPAAPANASAPIFIESSIAPTNPYVQQVAIYTVRLYFAVPPLDPGLDVPPPDNGDLVQIGNQESTSVMIQGHRYEMLERRYALQPERSGALHLPAPVFQGRTMVEIGNMLDDAISGNDAVRVVGKPIDVQVRERPSQAPDPWLPARAVQLSVDPPATPLHANEPFSVVVKIDGEGVTAAQLPEINLPAIAGAQIYPEPSTTAERARDGALLAERTRRFAIVPDHAGSLQLPALAVPWWDVVNDRAAVARLALPVLSVLPGAPTPGSDGNGSSTSTGNASNGVPVPPASDASVPTARTWQLATLALGVLLVLSLWWGWRRGHVEAGPHDDTHAPVARIPNRAPTLSRALALGDPAAITQALIEAAPMIAPHQSAARGLGEVAQRLDDAAQRAAVLAFDAARWSADGAAPAQTLAQLRTAFSKPPQWTGRPRAAFRDQALPPLYPS